MRLGFHYHIPADQRDGKIWLPGYLGRFLDSLACEVERLELFLHEPLHEEKELLDYALQAPKVNLVSLGPHTSVPSRLFRSRQILMPLLERRENLDALLIRGPSPLLPAVARTVGHLPLALLLVGDYLAGVDDLPQPRWRKEAIRVFSRWNACQQLAVAKRSLTFVNSRKLYQQLLQDVPRLVETRTTTLTEDDFFLREDTCQGRPVRLLYTGRMDRAKGLLLLVETLGQLVNLGEDVIVDLVGMPVKGDSVLEEITALAERLGISGRVVYHGHRPVGPLLFHFYENADIYVLGSLAAEGFPRTIWEAMAHSLPVVATRVGSIPGFIGGAAEIVDAGSVEALKVGILSLIKDHTRRMSYIKKGRDLARQVTMEALVPKMVEEIRTWVDSSKR